MKLFRLILALPLLLQAFPDTIEYTKFADGFQKPLWMSEIPGQNDAYLVLEQYTGRIVLLEGTPGNWTESVFYRVDDVYAGGNETGLLGLAFHPNFTENRLYYLNYNQGNQNTIIAERRAAADFKTDDGHFRQVMEIEQPADNHQGGCLLFGRDGYLYIGMGDGGLGNDPWNKPTGNGQAPINPLGTMLRIDVDNTEPGLGYGFPPDNPFTSISNVRPDVWAWGLRNPWRFSFDQLTGKLWAGDVGQDGSEEISIIEKGDNHGWRVMEGFRCAWDNIGSGVKNCDDPSFKQPVLDYPTRVDGKLGSVTGGYVYRGNPTSPWYGAYFFAEYIRDSLYVTDADNPSNSYKAFPDPGRIVNSVTSFAADNEGNLYIIERTGAIYKLELGDPMDTELKTGEHLFPGLQLLKAGKTGLVIRSLKTSRGSLYLRNLQGGLLASAEILPSKDTSLKASLWGRGVYVLHGEVNGLPFSRKVRIY